jgi:hypothetical protein
VEIQQVAKAAFHHVKEWAIGKGTANQPDVNLEAIMFRWAQKLFLVFNFLMVFF